MTVIYLVQHGEKERGPGDPGLTARGRAQAAATARWLRRMELTALYTSPLRRARQTAELIAAATDLVVQVDDRLRERVNWEAGEPLGRFLADWERSTRDRDFVLSNGESSRSAGERLRGFLADLAGGTGSAAAVSHGGITADVLRTLSGDAALPPQLLAEGFPGCAITMFGDLDVIAIGSTGHLIGTRS